MTWLWLGASSPKNGNDFNRIDLHFSWRHASENSRESPRIVWVSIKFTMYNHIYIHYVSFLLYICIYILYYTILYCTILYQFCWRIMAWHGRWDGSWPSMAGSFQVQPSHGFLDVVQDHDIATMWGPPIQVCLLVTPRYNRWFINLIHNMKIH